MLAVAASAMISFTACSGNTTGQSGNQETASEAPQENNTLVQPYLKIKDGLVASDADATAEAAWEMLDVIEEGGAEAADLQAHVRKIADVRDIDEQRTHFDALSESMYELAKSGKLESGTLYYQHCPMAFNNKGAYWLSAEEEIRNPYFGDKMLKCGSVKETIQ